MRHCVDEGMGGLILDLRKLIYSLGGLIQVIGGLI